MKSNRTLFDGGRLKVHLFADRNLSPKVEVMDGDNSLFYDYNSVVTGVLLTDSESKWILSKNDSILGWIEAANDYDI